MSPEAIEDSARSDPRSDIYSLGALGYYLLTGVNVFEAQSLQELYEKHLREPPRPPTQRTTNVISAEMERTLLQCLEKKPDLRPQSVGELRALLLTSPHASDWNHEARAGWWKGFEGSNKRVTPGTVLRAASPLEATVRIDVGDRIKKGSS
jgi:serine/threonine-protein kinase